MNVRTNALAWIFCLLSSVASARPVGRALERAARAEQAHDFDEAVRLYEQALPRAFARSARRLCPLYAALRRWKQAASLYARAVQRDPSNAYFWHCLGLAHHELGEYREAAQAFRKEVRLRPHQPGGWFALGRTLAAMGRRAEAATALSRYLALEERPWAKPWRSRARVLLERLLRGQRLPGWVWGARRPQRPIAETRGRHSKLAARAWKALRQGRIQEAMRLAEELRRRFPRDAAGYLVGAEALEALGRRRAAVAVLRLGLRNVASFDAGRLRLARIMAEAGQREEAEFQLQVLAGRRLPKDLARRASELARRLGLFGLAERLERSARQGR